MSGTSIIAQIFTSLRNFLGLSKTCMGLNFCCCPGSQGLSKNQTKTKNLTLVLAIVVVTE